MPAEADVAARRCGYSQCASPLIYDGRGRPPEYCAERRWPDGRTCKQMAAAERAGERAIGLDLPLEAFRAAGDRLTPQLHGLAEHLTALAATIEAVRDGAMGRIGVAEQEAVAAAAAQREAETASETAQAAMTSAVAARDEALAVAERATTAAEAARLQAQQQVAQAWEKASAADRARGAAEEAAARSDEAERVALAQLAEVGEAKARALAEVETWRARLHALEQRAMALVHQVEAAQARVSAESRRADGAEQVLAVIRGERQEYLDQLGSLRERLSLAQAELTQTAAAAATAMAESAAATTSATVATARATAAEHRLDAVVGLVRGTTGGRAGMVDLNHVIEAGMVTYPGLPGPSITAHLSREASRATYAPGTEFAIDSITMVGNTGTYLDSPFHRYGDGVDLAGLSLESLADLPVVLVRLPDGHTAFEPWMLPGPAVVAGAAVLLATGWDRHWGTPAYGTGAPYLSGPAAQLLADAGAALVGIDSVNIDDTSGGERPAHSILLAGGIPVLEHLTGLDAVPPAGARLHAVPPRVRGFGTFPVRAYVVLPG